MSVFDSFFAKKKKINIEERRKKAFFRFFDIVFHKFSKLVAFNLMYFACILPLVCGLITFVVFLFNISPEVVDSAIFINVAMRLVNFIPMPIFAPLFVISLIAYGPLTAGLTYTMRNIAEEEHTWYSDLFTRAWSNKKQGIALGLIDMGILTSFLLYLAMDFSTLSGGTLIYYQIIRVVAIIAAIIYFCLRFYTYSIAVTFELPIKGIFKNAFIFSVLGFFRNLLAFLIIFLITISFTSTPRLDVILIGALFFSISRFSAIFTTYPVIKKYMLNAEEKKTE